ncbi:hypothetical protein VNO77_37826 [Canavalia gladiata]|uniref:Uncharacterized protein n=1 Tax=Canavalia gladiata TaxID=3824 RepID=A0AAN9KCE7_CANGL
MVTQSVHQKALKRKRVKEVTEEGFFVAFGLTVGAKEDSFVTSELNRAELVTQGRLPRTIDLAELAVAVDALPEVKKEELLLKALFRPSMSKMGPDRQPTPRACCALARLTPTCLLPTRVKDLIPHHSRNLTKSASYSPYCGPLQLTHTCRKRITERNQLSPLKPMKGHDHLQALTAHPSTLGTRAACLPT